MKKVFSILALCMLLTGCTSPSDATMAPTSTEAPVTTAAPTETTVPPTTTEPDSSVTVTLYLPDENAIGFETMEVIIETLDPQLVVDQLIQAGALNEGIVINQAKVIDGQLNLDFNQAFFDQLITYGTAGERMMIGSVVNTFLNAYEAETVYITVGDQIMESGHVIYDFPLSFFE